jgi:hypothetical protein
MGAPDKRCLPILAGGSSALRGELSHSGEMDEWLAIYNKQRTHHGRWCFGKTPMQTFLDTASLAREKQTPAKAA